MSTPAPVRANRDGNPCPFWCATEHEKPISKSGIVATHHGTEVPLISFPDGYVVASAYQNGFSDDPPQIWIGSLTRPGMTIDLAQAEILATLAEMLAGAAADQHRELAAQIRKAAADIEEARDGQ